MNLSELKKHLDKATHEMNSHPCCGSNYVYHHRDEIGIKFNGCRKCGRKWDVEKVEI